MYFVDYLSQWICCSGVSLFCSFYLDVSHDSTEPKTLLQEDLGCLELQFPYQYSSEKITSGRPYGNYLHINILLFHQFFSTNISKNKKVLTKKKSRF